MKTFVTAKIVLSLIAVLLSASSALTQMQNPGFESWTSGEPDNWKTNNANPFSFITQTSDAHAGSSAAHGVVVDLGGGFTLGPVLKSGSSSAGFPVNQRYAALHLWYKFTGAGGDQFQVTIGFSKQGNGVGGGTISDSSGISTYKELVIPISYNDDSVVPDTGVIAVDIFPLSGPHAGSAFTVDDFGLDLTTDVSERSPGLPDAFSLHQNYPNPFNPTTKIVYDIPVSSHVRLAVYDILGREVATLVNEHEAPGRYRADLDASGLPSGMYFYRIEAGGFIQTNSMMLVK